jgi:hypothetical protein
MLRVSKWSLTGAVLALAFATLAGTAQAGVLVDVVWPTPRISIVWPHDGNGVFTTVVKSKEVNISVWPSNSVSCTAVPSPALAIWRARNNEPAEILTVKGELLLRNQDNVKFPSLEFNDVPADMASDPLNRFYFLLGFQGNIWVDAADARTYLPNPLVPTGFSADKRPAKVDTRIQIVYPHDSQGNFVTVDKATLANVAVDVFEHGTLNTVPLDYDASGLVLYIAEATSPMNLAKAALGDGSTIIAVANPEPYTFNNVKYPRWVFNNVVVEPGKQYHYLVKVLGAETYPSLWTHASDVRTYLPNPPLPPACK